MENESRRKVVLSVQNCVRIEGKHVLQNANILAPNNSDIHSSHLNGHDFWVLAYGDGAFNPGEDAHKFNLRNPPLQNTVVLFPYGWTTIRFVADNAGAWAFHSHIEPHFHMGIGVVFAEGIEKLGKLPRRNGNG